MNLSVLWEGTKDHPDQVRARNATIETVTEILRQVQFWSEADQLRTKDWGDSNSTFASRSNYNFVIISDIPTLHFTVVSIVLPPFFCDQTTYVDVSVCCIHLLSGSLRFTSRRSYPNTYTNFDIVQGGSAILILSSEKSGSVKYINTSRVHSFRTPS